MESDTLLSRSNNFVSRHLGDELVLIPINQTGVDVQKIYALNDTAEAVWDKIKTPLKISELFKAIESEYSDDEGIIKKEVKQLIEEFVHAGFIKIIRG